MGGIMVKPETATSASVPKTATIGVSNTILQQSAQRAFASDQRLEFGGTRCI
jgi:hypothetical protein